MWGCLFQEDFSLSRSGSDCQSPPEWSDGEVSLTLAPDKCPFYLMRSIKFHITCDLHVIYQVGYSMLPNFGFHIYSTDLELCTSRLVLKSEGKEQFRLLRTLKNNFFICFGLQ